MEQRRQDLYNWPDKVRNLKKIQGWKNRKKIPKREKYYKCREKGHFKNLCPVLNREQEIISLMTYMDLCASSVDYFTLAFKSSPLSGGNPMGKRSLPGFFDVHANFIGDPRSNSK